MDNNLLPSADEFNTVSDDYNTEPFLLPEFSTDKEEEEDLKTTIVPNVNSLLPDSQEFKPVSDAQYADEMFFKNAETNLEVITETDRLLRDMSTEDQDKISELTVQARKRHSEFLRKDPYSEKGGSIKRRRAVIEEIKKRGDVFANQVFSDDPLLDTQKENRKHAIKYVDNMMERYGITREEAFVKILDSNLAKNNPNSPLALYAFGVSTEEAANMAAEEAANLNFGPDAVDTSKSSVVESLNSPNLVTRKLAKEMLDAGYSLAGINFATQADAILNPVTWLANVPDHINKIERNMSKRDWYEVSKEEHDELLDIDSVEITKEEYFKKKKNPELKEKLLIKETMVQGGEIKTGYFYAPYSADLKYDPEKKGYYYRSQKFEALPLIGNTAMLVLDILPATTVFKLGKKSFNFKQATKNKYSKQSVAKLNDLKINEKTIQTNKKIADDNWEVRQRYIEEFEERQSALLGRPIVIHTVVDGKKVIDPTKVREQGLAIAEAVHNKNIVTKIKEHVKLTEKDMKLSDLVTPIDEQMLPHVDPDKLNALVAVGLKLKKLNPEYFKKSDEVMPNGKKKTLIDQLFEYTIEGKLEKTDEFINVLADYGMSIDEFVLMTVGNVSEAGKILGKFSQLRGRRKGAMQLEQELDNKVFESGFKNFWNNWFLRGENIMRGALVTPWATAMRNLSSAGIRMPAEALVNVMEDVVFEFYKTVQASNSSFGLAPYKGIYAAGKKLNPLQGNSAWTNSFGDITSTLNAFETKRTVDYMLEHPMLEHLDRTLFGAVGELRKSMGRGQHTNPIANAADFVYTKGEDAVEFLNGPNRLQEFMIRRGVFLGQLRRLLKNEWNLDLEEEMFEKNNFQRILMDASVAADNVTKLKPDGARSIHAILEDATYKALDITYAKQPDFFLFRDVSRFISNTGLTALPGLTFPRFLFNGIELMGKNMMGSTLPVLRAITGKVKSAADVRGVGENLVGWAAIYGMYQLINQKDKDGEYIQPEDYNLINYGGEIEDIDGNMVPTNIDVRGNFPLAQIKYIAQALREVQTGTFELFDPQLRKAQEAFLGNAFRTGRANMFLKDVRDLVIQADSSENKRTASEVFGRAIGQWGSRLFTPAFQLTDLQRVSGIKPLERKDNLPSITTPTTIFDSAKRSFFQRWGSLEEKDYVDKVNVYGQRGTKNQRVGLGTKLWSGISYVQADSEEGNYLLSLGKNKGIDFTSRLRDPTARNYQNQLIKNALPLHVAFAKEVEKIDNENYYKKNKTYKSKYSKKLSGKLAALEYINNSLNKILRTSTDPSKTESGLLASSIINYRNIPKTKRKISLKKWYTYNDKEPDFSNPADVQTLILYSK